jgi:DNA (cytosine-5)-methyltransferase 1
MLKIIELFSGIGSQTKALQRLGVQHEVVGISEWDVNAIIAYDAIHTNDNKDHSKSLSRLEVYNELKDFTFSTDGKKPCDLKRVKEKLLRQLYNAHKRTKNLGS